MSRRYAIVCVLAMLSTSAVAAAWSGKGTSEPSTSLDRLDGYMFTTADTAAAGNKVYLNGYVTDGQSVRTPTSPNLATPGTAFAGPKPMPVALFGVWKDCNRDGFVGFGDNALFEYPAELLGLPGGPGTSICAPSATPDQAHNFGGTVREFFPIVWGNMTNFSERGYVNDPWSIYDGPSRVWVDKGKPTQELGLPCHIYPQPEGTFQTTGGAIALADCHTGYAVTSQANSIGTVGGVQIGFNDVEQGQHWQSNSVLNQRYPLGNSDESESAVRVYDCAAPLQTVQTERTPVADPTGGTIEEEIDGSPDGDLAVVPALTWNVYPPAPGANPAGSVRGTANYTEEELGENCDDNPTRGVATNTGTDSFHPDAGESRADQTDCAERMADFAVIFVEPAYACETPGKVPGGRIRPDVQLFPITAPNRHPAGDPVPTGDPVADARAKATRDANVAAANAQAMFGASLFQAWGTFEAIDMKHGAEVQYVTYYGYVSSTAVSTYGLTLPPSIGAYGADACSAGVSSFNCDPNAWWKDASGNDFNDLNVRDFPRGNTSIHWQTGDPRVFLNQAFQLRDVDCYDLMVQPLRDQGLTVQAIVSGSRCT